MHERLNAEAEQLRLEAKRREEKRLEEELKGATFTPEIPNSSTQILVRKQTLERKLSIERQSISTSTISSEQGNEMENVSPVNASAKNVVSPTGSLKKQVIPEEIAMVPAPSVILSAGNSPVALAAKKLLEAIVEEEHKIESTVSEPTVSE